MCVRAKSGNGQGQLASFITHLRGDWGVLEVWLLDADDGCGGRFPFTSVGAVVVAVLSTLVVWDLGRLCGDDVSLHASYGRLWSRGGTGDVEGVLEK